MLIGYIFPLSLSHEFEYLGDCICEQKKDLGHNGIQIMYLRDLTQPSQQTRDFLPMVGQCWVTVYDVGPTLSQHWVKVPCLLGNNQCSVLAPHTQHYDG